MQAETYGFKFLVAKNLNILLNSLWTNFMQPSKIKDRNILSLESDFHTQFTEKYSVIQIIHPFTNPISNIFLDMEFPQLCN